MEPIRRIETPLGPVEFRGRDTGRPVQLVITAAFASEGQLGGNQARFPDLDVWRAHLPGNHCPELVALSVGAFGAAFSSALRIAAPGRPVAAVGVSAGALAALAMDQALLRGLVLVEPPLRPSSVWPFRGMRGHWPAGADEFFLNIFGVAADHEEERDYTPLLERLRTPTLVLVGGEPLGARRELPEYPSFVDPISRERLAAHPLVELEVFEGAGHYMFRDAERFMAALERGMRPIRPAARAGRP